MKSTNPMAHAGRGIGVSAAVAVVLIAVRLWIFVDAAHPGRWLGLFESVAFLLQMAVMTWFLVGYIAASRKS